MAKQARILDDKRFKQAVDATRDARELCMLLLSHRAGLRAIEIAGLRWGDIDFEVGELRLKITKGGKPRTVPIAADLRKALDAYRPTRAGKDGPEAFVFVNRHAAPGSPLRPAAVTQWFWAFYRDRLGWEGYSSHSGRRTFCTRVARRISSVGGSLRDVQSLMGHSSLTTTQRYIEVNPDAAKKVVDL